MSLRLFLILLVHLLVVCAHAQTSSNTCGFNAANEYPVNNNMCLFQPFNVLSSYTASMNPNSCSSGNDRDAWGWFTATADFTVVTFDPESSHRSILHVFTGACNNLQLVECRNSGGNGINAQVVINTVPGQNYMFRVQRHNSNSAMPGSICIYVPPANDDCTVSIELPVDTMCHLQTFTNQGATYSTETPSPTCGGTINSSNTLDIWFHFYAPESGMVVIDVEPGTLTDGVMQLYAGSCSPLTLIQCDDNSGTGNMPRIDRSCSPLVPFQLYSIRFWGRNGAMGTFELCVRELPVGASPQEDCSGGHSICNDQNITNNASSIGCTQDLNSGNRGCLASNERQGTWYFFSPSTTGTYAFTITPVNALGQPAAVDYDFALWGPMDMMTCPPSQAPLRCSYASPTNSGFSIGAGTYLTGLAVGNSDTSEPAYNSSGNNQVNGFVAPLVVSQNEVGRRYTLYIDNFSQDGQRFTVTWSLTNGASLTCMILPVELMNFTAQAAGGKVDLERATASEIYSDHFLIERSVDGVHFHAIGYVQAAGTSVEQRRYVFTDHDPIRGVSFYRLKQVDLDGGHKLWDIVMVRDLGQGNVLAIHPNPAQESMTIELAGDHDAMVLIQFFDRTGRLVREMERETGNGVIHLSIEELAPGSYFVKTISDTGMMRTGRVVKY